MSYILYADGSCYTHKNQGGWAFILKTDSVTITQNGFLQSKSINHLELLAVINGLEAVQDENVEITVYTDSSFVMYCPKRTKKSKWVGPLVLRLHELMEIHKVQFIQLPPGERPAEHTTVHYLAREAALKGACLQQRT